VAAVGLLVLAAVAATLIAQGLGAPAAVAVGAGSFLTLVVVAGSISFWLDIRRARHRPRGLGPADAGVREPRRPSPNRGGMQATAD